jgi:hypothetical protein
MTSTTVTPRQAPRRRRTIPVVLGATALVVTGAVAFGVHTARELRSETTSVSFSGVRELSVDIDEGRVALRRAAGAALEITTTRSWRPGYEPTTQRTFAGGVVTLTADCADFNLGCETVQEIAVPAGTAVRVRTVDGTITASDLDTPRFSATAVAGVVDASFSRAPDAVAVETTSGAVRVALPPASYRISADAVMGAVRIAVPSDPAAQRTVSAETVAGAIEVTPR